MQNFLEWLKENASQYQNPRTYQTFDQMMQDPRLTQVDKMKISMIAQQPGVTKQTLEAELLKIIRSKGVGGPIRLPSGLPLPPPPPGQRQIIGPPPPPPPPRRA